MTGENRVVRHIAMERALLFFLGMSPTFRTKAVYTMLDAIARPGGVWPDRLSPTLTELKDMCEATARTRLDMHRYNYTELFITGPQREAYSYVRETDLNVENRFEHAMNDSILVSSLNWENMTIAGRAGPTLGAAEVFSCENAIVSMKYSASYTANDEVTWPELWLPKTRGGVPIRVPRQLVYQDVKAQIGKRSE